MKRRTDILTHLLLLLLLLVACTADDAIKENLSHQDEYVIVRMHIPGLTSTATRAVLEDNITSIVALVFRNDQLKSVTEYTTANSTLNPISSISGTITIDKPTDGDVIHFLANLPANYSNDKTYISYLNEQLDKSQTDILCSLSSRDYSTLSYWGMDTYNSGDVQMDVNLYRNKAMIEIQPDAGCTFMENELFIAGLINPNNVGLLVPYNDGFNFDLNTYDYKTLPADPDPLGHTDELTNYGTGYDNAYYVFEHANPKDENGLYVICKIGDDYYKVALQDENGNHYEIIRNHKYTILVKDLDEGCNTYAEALTSDPINLMVVEKTDVTLTLTPKANTIYYNSTSVSAVTITVGGIVSQVETLTFTAPGYTILSDYAEPESNNVFRITDKTLNEINFTLTLTDPSQATSVSVTAGGEFVNSNTPSTSFTLTENEESAGEIIMWQGAVEMHNPADGTKYAGKVLIPYSFFFDGNNQKILEGSEMRLEYNGVGYIQTYLFIDEEPSIWNITESTELTLTQGLLNSIKDSHTTVWGVDAAFMFEGGEGAVLNKVTLIPVLQSIAATANKTQLYYDSDDAQVVTVNVTVPDGVETLNIGGAGNFAVAKTEGDGTLNGTTYTLGSGRTATFTFTLNSQNVTEQQTITFSDPTESVNSASVAITMAPTPTVTFTNTGSQTIRLNDTPLSVTMDVPDDKTLSEFGITITPATGLNVAQGENQLTLTEGVYTTTSGVSDEQTFTFTPTVAGTYTITFSGEGTDVNMPDENNRTINLTVGAAAATTLSVTAVDGDSTIDLDSDDTNVTFTLTKPSGLQNVSVNITNANGSKANSYFTINANNADLYYDQNNDNFNNITDYNNTDNIPITFTVKDNSIPGGEYTATFTGNYNGQNITATATITIVNTPTVSFSNTGKQTLYWNGGTNPTTFKVEMTNIPTDGSVTLSITAADFVVSVTEGTITGSDGTYTYTGGNTDFTFTPTNYGTNKSITITGSGTKVKVPSLTTITVDVKNENAPKGYVVYGPEHNASETGIDFGNYKEYGLLGNSGNVDQALIQYFKAGATLVIEFSDVRDGASMKLQSWWSNVYKSFDLTSSNDNTYTFKATDFTGGTFSNAQDYINNPGAGLCLVGVKVTITKITIIPAPTTE